MWIPAEVLFDALFSPLSLSVAQLSAAGVTDDPEAERLACSVRLRVAGGLAFVRLVYAHAGATCTAKARFRCADAEAAVDGVRRAIVGTYLQAREELAPLPLIK